MVTGTNTCRAMVSGSLAELGSVGQTVRRVERTKKDGSTYETSVGTSHVVFRNKNGQEIGTIDCNAANHAAKVVAYFFVRMNQGTIKGVESAFDADPNKKPPARKVVKRSKKSAPATTTSSSTSSEGKKSKKSKKPAPPPPVEDSSSESDSDSEPELASDDE